MSLGDVITRAQEIGYTVLVILGTILSLAMLNARVAQMTRSRFADSVSS
jgi:hypothetical protein